jgi:hypothetical protein
LGVCFFKGLLSIRFVIVLMFLLIVGGRVHSSSGLAAGGLGLVMYALVLGLFA